ncbi:hypothetical protein MF6396_10375 [Pseudomonas sp. MF6396]|uniref:hypothetical protein n=1 Tax=Pseudomonas sp. MF6396 TaxID=1960828 RepID=UPI0009967035|nr:hypothetical protein [Pseudomonas sp. MF6396]OOW03395.1 hypothetical protein MF6396_10375 [Pseudomonas sp. MF6396]
MLRLKKAAGPRTKLQKHDNQGTRVTVDGKESKKERGKGNRIKRLRDVVKELVIRQALLDLWENKLEYWEYVCDAMDKLIGLIS